MHLFCLSTPGSRPGCGEQGGTHRWGRYTEPNHPRGGSFWVLSPSCLTTAALAALGLSSLGATSSAGTERSSAHGFNRNFLAWGIMV